MGSLRSSRVNRGPSQGPSYIELNRADGGDLHLGGFFWAVRTPTLAGVKLDKRPYSYTTDNK